MKEREREREREREKEWEREKENERENGGCVWNTNVYEGTLRLFLVNILCVWVRSHTNFVCLHTFGCIGYS